MAGIPGKGGIKGRSGPPGNMNAFRHGLAALSMHRDTGVLSEVEQSVREEILNGLVQDKGGEQQIGTAMRVLAEIIASDSALLVSFNRAIDTVLVKNSKAKGNPAALAKLDSYKRPLVTSLSGNLQRFGFDRITKTKTLQEIIDSMPDETGENSNRDSPGAEESDCERDDAALSRSGRR